jgi:hypothetical protein
MCDPRVALWFPLKINDHTIGTMEIRRVEYRDLDDPGIDDTINTYVVMVDGRQVGELRHRYGDGAWTLVRSAFGLEW